MHLTAITSILQNDALLAQLYSIANVGELCITIILFYLSRETQKLDGDTYQHLIDLHFNKLTEEQAEEALFAKSTKRQWLEYAEIVGFIILVVSQIFTTWYILQP